MNAKDGKVAVVVLGDIGHSPRMRYHAYSLCTEKYDTTVLAYLNSDISASVLDKHRIIPMTQPPDFRKYVPSLLSFILKVAWQTMSLLFVLIYYGRFRVVLVQNPPAIPTLIVCWLYCVIFRAKMITDWHNYAYTIFSLSYGQNHFLTRFSEKYERFFGKLSHNNICVTNAMKEDLSRNWGIRAQTLYDRPGPLLKSEISDMERMALFSKLGETVDRRFKHLLNEKDKYALLISSTSWTEDEDFSILLNALEEYDNNENVKTNLICVITGKGPLKQYYVERMSTVTWKKVMIITPWLDAEDYPLLLACGDLGVCLHTSSSGLDLPMKVVDMFGAGLPVCAYSYECLKELVRHGENGLTFKNSAELASQLISWFMEFPRQNEQQRKFRESAQQFAKEDWHSNWKKSVEPLFRT